MGGSNRSRIAVVLQQVPRGRKLPSDQLRFLDALPEAYVAPVFPHRQGVQGYRALCGGHHGRGVHRLAHRQLREHPGPELVRHARGVHPQPGADPAAEVSKLGERIGFPSSRFKFISLGQGQEEVSEWELIISLSKANTSGCLNLAACVQAAINMFQVGYTRGNWVMLQNCHLLVRFLHVLEKELEDMAKPHEEFRLWLTTDPISNFPIGILQRSFKVVTEPPTGINLNMQKVMNESLHTCAHKAYHQLIYILTFFHSVVLDRRKYGKLGWNISYDFNHSDFDVCMQIINIYLNKTLKTNDPKIPWATLRYLIGE
ncbi:DNAH10, partial [Cordylochernes scorpioides]